MSNQLPLKFCKKAIPSKSEYDKMMYDDDMGSCSSKKDNCLPINKTTTPGSNLRERSINNQVRLPQLFDIIEEQPHMIYSDDELLLNQPEMFRTPSSQGENKLCTDKTTYCRPVVNLYNQQFLYKTVQRNAKLQKLVQELSIARQKEKERHTWNDFINHLRAKHREHKDMPSCKPIHEQSDYINGDVMNDYYNTKFAWEHSDSCHTLLRDIYRSYDVNQILHGARRMCVDRNFKSDYNKPDFYTTQTLCNPISSHRRIIELDREIYKNNCILNSLKQRQNGRKQKPEYIPKVFFCNVGKNNYREYECSPTGIENLNNGINISSMHNLLKTSSVQTVLSTKNKENKVVEPTTDIVTKDPKEKVSEDNFNKQSLGQIEDKLDKLLKSINSFMTELNKNNFNKIKPKNTGVSCNIKIKSNSKNESVDAAKNEQLVCGILKDSSQSTVSVSIQELSPSKHTKSSKSKRQYYYKDIINTDDKPCAIKLLFDIPSRDCSTEVTDSLSRVILNTNENKITDDSTSARDKQMTIAVNTEPLGIFALLRISTETLKRLLSYMPQIDYYSFLPTPQLRDVKSRYVCNICGAAFDMPSVLSDHIQEHNLGKTRDCCVCRHALDEAQRRIGLFRCQYCGQHFTRAYCCELHQESCARRFGKKHDVSSSLMLLK